MPKLVLDLNNLSPTFFLLKREVTTANLPATSFVTDFTVDNNNKIAYDIFVFTVYLLFHDCCLASPK